MEEEKPHYDLVTLCPPATFGPLRHSISSIASLNESNARLWKRKAVSLNGLDVRHFTDSQRKLLVCFDSAEDAPMPYLPVHTYVDVRVSQSIFSILDRL
jgi:hypothetical protein